MCRPPQTLRQAAIRLSILESASTLALPAQYLRLGRVVLGFGVCNIVASWRHGGPWVGARLGVVGLGVKATILEFRKHINQNKSSSHPRSVAAAVAAQSNANHANTEP